MSLLTHSPRTPSQTDTVKLASMRGDVLSNRLGDALEKTEGQQLMVQSIVRQVENSNDALRAREKQLEKQNMHLTAQLRLSQIAVGDMLRRYKIAESAVEASKIEVYELKQALKPKRKGEVRDDATTAGIANATTTGEGKKKKKPPGMAGSTTANANKMYMQKLAALTSESAKQMFPQDKKLYDNISNSILSGPYDDADDDYMMNDGFDSPPGGGGSTKSGGGKGFGSTGSGGGGGGAAMQAARAAADAEAAAAMAEYNSFIYDDNNSVGSQSTFQSGSVGGGLDGGHGMYGNPDLNLPQEASLSSNTFPGKSGQVSVSGGSSFGGAASFGGFDVGATGVSGGGESVAQMSHGGLSGGLAIFDYSTSSAGGAASVVRGGSTIPGAHATPMPQLLEEQEAHAAGKANLLAAYLRLAISVQNHSGSAGGRGGTMGTKTLPLLNSASGSGGSNAMQALDFARCELVDADLKKIVDLLRLLSLRELNTIDLRHNHFTIKAVEIVSAFIVSIAGADLQRTIPLEIDLRYNHFSAKAIEQLGSQLRQTPRPEVKLVAFEENNQVILMYGTNKTLIKIDCRNNTNDSRKAKKSLKQRITLGANITGELQVAFPGDDVEARNPNYFEGTIYPRDDIMNQRLTTR